MQNLLKASAVTILALLAFGAVDANAQGGGGGGGGGGMGLVQCPADSLQAAIDGAKPGRTIFIEGTCVEDVTITADDVTLSGNEAGVACTKASPGGTGTIEGTITVDSVRASIEFLTITGNGAGVLVTNRADARLTCNDISDNQESGVVVLRASNAVLRDNTLSSNGQQGFNSPFVFFDTGLFVGDASSVRSDGNTYKDNQYAAVDVERQGAFRNGSFLPREPGNPPIPAEKDVIIQKGGNPLNAATCKTSTGGPIAIEVFNNGLVDLRNADVCGEIESVVNSTFRIDDAGGTVIGNVLAAGGSFVRIRDRSNLGDGRLTTFNGTLACFNFSGTFSSSVNCGQTCNGTIPGSCTP